VPAVAVNQREQVIPNWNRLKGCVGASLELVRKSWMLIHWLTFYLWKWNIIRDEGIASGRGRILRNYQEYQKGGDTHLDNIDSDARRHEQ